MFHADMVAGTASPTGQSNHTTKAKGEPMQAQIIQQGSHPTLGRFVHTLLVDAETGVSHVLAQCGDRAVIHKILQTGEVVSSALDLPLLRAVLGAIDTSLEATVQQ
jgi:hypothetical protein